MHTQAVHEANQDVARLRRRLQDAGEEATAAAKTHSELQQRVHTLEEE